MPEHTQLNLSPRDKLLMIAQEEMAKFEANERQLRHAEKQERALALGLPAKAFGRDERH